MSRPLPLGLSDDERRSLITIVRSPSAQAREVLRARIVLAADKGLDNGLVAEQIGCNIETVRLWRNRFHALRMDGLRDQPRRGRKAVYGPAKEAEILAATLTPPKQTTHWSARRLAKQVGVSKSTVHRVWQNHDLQPHREETFKFSRDPQLVEKVIDIVGLYLNPPENALVLCVDEKSQIQALERTQPVLPLGPGRPAARTHDYQRNGTTTLFAALNLTQPEVVGRCAKRHRHQEFLTFMRQINLEYPEGEIHLILDNYGTHKHEKVEKWFARRPRFHRHFTPTSASFMNMVETWFSILTRQRIRRGSFSSEQQLQKALHSWMRDWNEHPHTFRWVKTAEQVLRHYSLDN